MNRDPASTTQKQPTKVAKDTREGGDIEGRRPLTPPSTPPKIVKGNSAADKTDRNGADKENICHANRLC